MHEGPITTRTRVRPTNGEELLTGLYPCLTLQLNVTAHQEQETAKMVLSVREPNQHERYVHVEIPLGDWWGVSGDVLGHVSRGLAEMQRLLGFKRPTA